MLTFFLLVGSTCRTEDNIDYYCSDCSLNDGTNDKVNDMEACKSLCESNYPGAYFFSYVNCYWGTNPWGSCTGTYSRTCWCRTSDAGRKSDQNVISGDLNCGCKSEFWFYSLFKFFGKNTLIKQLLPLPQHLRPPPLLPPHQLLLPLHQLLLPPPPPPKQQQ